MERDHTVGEQVIAGTHVRREIRTWISDAPIKQVSRRIIASRVPCRAAARSPRIIFPALVSDFAQTRDRFKFPLSLTSRCIVGSEKPTSSELASCYPDHDR